MGGHKQTAKQETICKIVKFSFPGSALASFHIKKGKGRGWSDHKYMIYTRNTWLSKLSGWLHRVTETTLPVSITQYIGHNAHNILLVYRSYM